MRNWEMLYERQPLHLDVVLFVLALAFHYPLIYLHIKAPPKNKDLRSWVDIVEERIPEKKEEKKKVILPPVIPDKPKDIKTIVKKVEQTFHRPPPPPPPQPKKIETLIQTPPPVAKLDVKKFNPEEARKALQDKGSFKGRDPHLLTPAAQDIKMAAAGASLQANSRLPGPGVPQGGTLKGKTGFTMAKDALPMGIGGGDEGGLRGGAAENIVAVPVGAKAMGNASILSPVVKDKGSLKNQGPVGVPGGTGTGSGGLVGTGSGASAIQGTIASRGPVMASVPVPAKTAGKTFTAKTPSTAVSGPNSVNTSAAAPALPRRTVPKQKPMFQITGPLANRTVLSRALPPYPEWARQKGIEASVTLQFSVTPEGAVKDRILILRTSGFPALDESAMDALRRWKFAPLPPDQYREEVGTITMSFAIQ
jgi:TonB family protein